MEIRGLIMRDEIVYIRNMQKFCNYGLIVLRWGIDIFAYINLLRSQCLKNLNCWDWMCVRSQLTGKEVIIIYCETVKQGLMI